MKKIISMLLAVSLVFGIVTVTVSAAETGAKKQVYTVLGDSNAAGYALDAYIANCEAQGVLVDDRYVYDEMYCKIIADANDYDLRCDAHSAWRAADAIRFLSDDYDYNNGYNFYLNGFGLADSGAFSYENHMRMISDVRDSDIITVQFSSNDILSQALMTTIDDVLNSRITELDINIGKPQTLKELCEAYEKIFKAAEIIGDTASVALGIIDYFYEFEEKFESDMTVLISRIRELNDHAQIYVIGAINPLTTNGESYARLMANAENATRRANRFLRYDCPVKDEYTFVDITNVQTYGITLTDFVAAFDTEAIGAGDWTATMRAINLVHPTAKGHRYIAERVLEEIRNSDKAPTAEATRAKLSGAVTLKWTKVDGAVRYNVYRSVNGGAYKLVATTLGRTYIDVTAKRSSAYSYKVEAVLRINGKSVSGMSAPASVPQK